MDRMRQNGPFNYGTHWGIDPYSGGIGMRPFWNPYHGSMGLGVSEAAAAEDSVFLHTVLAAGIGGAVAGFASWDLSRAAVGAAALGGIAAGYDGATSIANGKGALGMGLLAVGVLGIFVAYTSARSWNKSHVHYGQRSY